MVSRLCHPVSVMISVSSNTRPNPSDSLSLTLALASAPLIPCDMVHLLRVNDKRASAGAAGI